MIIKIDYREYDLLEYFASKEPCDMVKIQKENLSIGDIIISDDNNNDILIIERKTITDLASSIYDGRYKEQSFRLQNSEIHNHNIVYLIEGSLDKKLYTKSINRNTLMSAIFSLNYVKGFSIVRTFTTIETGDYILQMVHKLNKTETQSYYTREDKEGGMQYSDTIKCVKKDNVTSENISEIMLAQIPNVSINVARKLIERFSNIKTLIKNLEENKDLLLDIKIEGKEGKLRKLNKNTIANIYNYLINV